MWVIVGVAHQPSHRFKCSVKYLLDEMRQLKLSACEMFNGLHGWLKMCLPTV